MDRIRYMAELSIRRAIGFAGLAIGMVVLALSYDPVLALKTGSALLAIAAVILLWFSWQAPQRDVRGTEVWILLDFGPRPPDPKLQRVIGGILRDAYMRYCRYTGGTALAFWIFSLIATLFPGW